MISIFKIEKQFLNYRAKQNHTIPKQGRSPKTQGTPTSAKGNRIRPRPASAPDECQG